MLTNSSPRAGAPKAETGTAKKRKSLGEAMLDFINTAAKAMNAERRRTERLSNRRAES